MRQNPFFSLIYTLASLATSEQFNEKIFVRKNAGFICQSTRATLLEGTFEKGQTVSDDQMKQLNIEHPAVYSQ